MRNFKNALAGATFVFCVAGNAQAHISDGVVRIGVLTDMAGPYSALSGEGSVVATKMAVDDCLKAECKGMKIEVVYADHQNKADVGSAKAREWIDRDKVDMLADMTNSSVALAIQKLIKEKAVIGLSNAGPGFVTAMKQAAEFSIGKSKDQRLAALLVFISDVHALGLQLAQGLTLTEGFYWDQDNAARAFSARFAKLHKDNKPTIAFRPLNQSQCPLLTKWI